MTHQTTEPSSERAELIRHMVNRFLAWKLPKEFFPDNFISFDREKHDTWGGYPNSWPTGTNLFTADQAKAMVEYLMDGYEPSALLSTDAKPCIHDAEWIARRTQEAYEQGKRAALLAEDKAGGEAVAWAWRFHSDEWEFGKEAPWYTERSGYEKRPLAFGDTHHQPQAEAVRVPEGLEFDSIEFKDALTDKFAEMLAGTYHCGRVWSAWNVGTMTEDDFSDVGESDTPAELADAVIAMLAAAPKQEPGA